MKTPFDIVHDILSSKQRYLLQPDDQMSPYIVQRGLSMSGPHVVASLNMTLNRLGDIDQQMFVDIAKLVTPKTNNYYKWIKKEKGEETEEDMDLSEQQINRISEVYEMSADTIKMIHQKFPTVFLAFMKEK
jgi:hypothetical protein